ncbi:MAG: ATP-binding protein [Candidatus Aenigmarchaeota archaeon]|nr:ATP-binding protein [Candidatus Aenigmarchaeota archaeon]
MTVEKIVIGRDREDLQRYKDRGTAFVGRHIVGSGELSHFTNPVMMDVIRPHVVLVCGKRGSGKSYTGGVIAEEMAMLPAEVRQNLAILMVDTMGIYWSMKLPNEKDRELLKEWGLLPKSLPVKLFVPKQFIKDYVDVGVRVDAPFTLPAGELSSMDWIISFGFTLIDPYGIAIERAVKNVSTRFGKRYSIDDIITEIEADSRTAKDVKDAIVNRFLMAKDWGIFERDGTPIRDMLQGGVVTVLDVSHYMRASSGWSVRSMVIGLLSRRIFQERLLARKSEEFEQMTNERRKNIPMVWMIMDEAHQFVPNIGETAASEPLLTLVKEGREPGISLLLITQQPYKLHTDALSQVDLIISHRLTARADMQALRGIMQSYVLDDIQELINSLPRLKGAAVILDDNSERLYTVQVRPRLSWHAGGSPVAIREKTLMG